MSGKGEGWNETWTLNKEMELDWIDKGGFEYELNAWPDSSIGYSIWTELSGLLLQMPLRQWYHSFSDKFHTYYLIPQLTSSPVSDFA